MLPMVWDEAPQRGAETREAEHKMERRHGVPARGEHAPRGTIFRHGRFGRMFPQLRAFEPPATALRELAEAMKDAKQASPEGDN